MPETPAAWLERLEHRLDERWFGRTWFGPGMGVFDAYYEGDHVLTFATQKFREAFGSLFGALADNWCPIVVDSSVERLTVQGFRFGDQQEADSDAWDIWQANNLDGQSDQLHTEAVKLGEAYWLVAPPNGSDLPRITAEHPSQMIVAWAPGNRHERLAALKKWDGDDGKGYANVYLPDRIVKYETKKTLAGLVPGLGKDKWKQVEEFRNPLEAVPVVPICNNPSMLRGGQSDLKSAIPVQNAINKLVCDMLIGSEYLAFPMRVLIGADVPRDPETGLPTRAAQQQASQARMLVFSDPEAKIAEFSAADLKNYTEATRALVRDLCAQTRTPPHYVLGEIVNASGDALKAAETGLTSKVRQKMSPFGEGHEEAMRLAFKAIGDESKAKATDAEVIWKDPESRSQGELVDSLVKLGTIGVPREVLWEKSGASPQEINRWRSMEQVDALLAETQVPVASNGAGTISEPGAVTPAPAPART